MQTTPPKPHAPACGPSPMAHHPHHTAEDTNVSRAGFHAREARRLLAPPAADTTDTAEQLDLLCAIAHALTSLAFTQLTPPPRRRNGCVTISRSLSEGGVPAPAVAPFVTPRHNR